MSKIIAVDFDGTICESRWPKIGAANYEVINHLKKRQKRGYKIILWTCREGNALFEAIAWCADRDLVFDAINENVPEIIAMFGKDCRKVYADEYIDDKSYCKFKLPYFSDGYKTGILSENVKLEEYIETKIDLLSNDFKIKLDNSTLRKLRNLKSEVSVDNFAKSILRESLGSD